MAKKKKPVRRKSKKTKRKVNPKVKISYSGKTYSKRNAKVKARRIANQLKKANAKRQSDLYRKKRKVWAKQKANQEKYEARKAVKIKKESKRRMKAFKRGFEF